MVTGVSHQCRSYLDGIRQRRASLGRQSPGSGDVAQGGYAVRARQPLKLVDQVAGRSAQPPWTTWGGGDGIPESRVGGLAGAEGSRDDIEDVEDGLDDSVPLAPPTP
jgi:hypothetical protein